LNDCHILIIDEPTVGVDIGAKEQIHHLIWKLAAEDRRGVILISSDMAEVIRLSTRILVFRAQQSSDKLMISKSKSTKLYETKSALCWTLPPN